jgi:hypothetical protein
MRLETKNNFAGESQQRFTGHDNRSILMAYLKRKFLSWAIRDVKEFYKDIHLGSS